MIYGGPRTVVAPDLLLLDSKLSVPPPRPGFVSRSGLIEKARGGGCRVIGETVRRLNRRDFGPAGCAGPMARIPRHLYLL
jgi:hypothetical protein